MRWRRRDCRPHRLPEQQVVMRQKASHAHPKETGGKTPSKLNRKNIALACTVIVAIGTVGSPVVDAIVGLTPRNSDTQQPPSVLSTPALTSTGPSSETIPAGDASTTPPPTSGPGCRSADGQVVSCSAAGSGILTTVTSADQCTSDALRKRWGFSSSVMLTITARNTPSGCLVLPSPLASQSGADGDDIAQAQRTKLNGKLLPCARTDVNTTVSCAAPHEYEWIGDWMNLPAGQNKDSWCQELAKQYTSDPLTADSQFMSKPFTSANGESRCSVRMRIDGLQMPDTVWNIGVQ